MIDETLQRIFEQTGRIEAKLDNVARTFDDHVRSDERLASDVAALAKRQRGFITVATATIVATGGYLAHKFFGVRL